MAFKGKDGSGWKEASAIYGKDATGWLYAKEVWAKDATGWKRAWTDCRKYDASGRDWSNPTTVTTYTGTCGNRVRVETTTRTKEGCPDDVRIVNTADPSCTSGCFTSSAVNCDGCGSATLYTANAGSNCTSYTVGSCGSWSGSTADTVTYNGQTLVYNGTPGYYYTNVGSTCKSCPTGCAAFGEYYIENCSVGGQRITSLTCGNCQNIFGTPC